MNAAAVTENTSDEKHRMEIPEQGVDDERDLDGLIDFFEREKDFWSTHASLLSQSITVQGHNHGVGDILSDARELVERVLSGLHNNDFESLTTFQRRARDYEIVVGQGRFGRIINELVSTGKQIQARNIFAIISTEYPQRQYSNLIAPLRAVFRYSPGALAANDISITERAVRSANQSKSEIEIAKNDLLNFINENKIAINELADLYREKLTLEAPATLWETEAKNQAKRWKWSLFAFVALTSIPIICFVIWSEFILNFIVKLTSTTSSGISVAGIAAISVPALFYAWLLKNVSRVFQQSMALADDANHRRALALTYLGLAENPKLVVKETERALILNALFRGTPNVATDDGPPAGILDLISSKTKGSG